MYRLKVEQVGPMTKAFHDKVNDGTVGSVFTFDESEFIRAGEGKILKSLFNQWNMIRVTEDIFSKANGKKAWIAGLIFVMCLLLIYFVMQNGGQQAREESSSSSSGKKLRGK